jgi:hypothetical protein
MRNKQRCKAVNANGRDDIKEKMNKQFQCAVRTSPSKEQKRNQKQTREVVRNVYTGRAVGSNCLSGCIPLGICPGTVSSLPVVVLLMTVAGAVMKDCGTELRSGCSSGTVRKVCCLPGIGIGETWLSVLILTGAVMVPASEYAAEDAARDLFDGVGIGSGDKYCERESDPDPDPAFEITSTSSVDL